MNIYDNSFPTGQWHLTPFDSAVGEDYYSVSGGNYVPCGHTYDGKIYFQIFDVTIEVGGVSMTCGGCGTGP